MDGFSGAMVCGRLPRSDSTAAVHRLVRDGHAEAGEFGKAVGADRARLLEAQKGFAFASGGQSDWLDLLRPIAKTFGGFERRETAGEDSVGPVTRWFRTNTFYRKPNIVSEISCEGGEIADALPGLKGGILSLIGPYTFAALVQDSHYSDPAELALGYMNAVAKSLPAVQRKGYNCLVLLEPGVGYDLSREGLRESGWAAECISLAKAEGWQLGVHFPLADARHAIAVAEESEADFLGIDCLRTEPEGVSTGKGLLLGVADGARAGIEALETSEKMVREFAGAEFSGKFYVGSNDRLWDVPFGVALEKIMLLSQLSGRLG
ncbi:MAG: hypothetical protein V1787_00605 [Candidatus Micrarchaeota archaeon]